MFEPALKEVLRLVTGQIKASKKEVKAVIMVGGFGHNVYLWVAINYEVKELRVDVMQSPNRQGNHLLQPSIPGLTFQQLDRSYQRRVDEGSCPHLSSLRQSWNQREIC